MLVSVDMDKMFGGYKDRKIAIYGLGTETQKALMDLETEYEIIGLLDSYRTKGWLYGKPIMSIDSAISAGISLIIVVARPGSCRAIANHIGSRCREKEIALIDIRGKNLLEKKQVLYHFSSSDGMSRTELQEKIGYADVVSFDLFDTLVMRRTLYSGDVAEHVNCRLKEMGIDIDDFCNKRLSSEKVLSANVPPTLTEIYKNVLKKTENSSRLGITAEELANLEWEIDFSLLVPRKEICTLFKEAVTKAKKVYVVSDTYYSREQLIQILDEKCGIVKYTDVLASSSCGTDKTHALFRVLKDKECTVCSEKFLHIGDDSVTDVQSAGNYGFNTFKLPSGVELLENVGSMGLADYVETLSDRLKVGMFVSLLFNSPFHFENKDRHIEILDARDIGYLLCAPMISDFVLWFYNRVEKGTYKNIWFSARDGYLVRKLFIELIHTYHKEDRSVYFLTSRTAAVRAGMRNEGDIRYVDEMKFSGTLEENLRERFGVSADEGCGNIISDDRYGLMKYKSVILEKSRKSYRNYQKYIGKLQIEEGDIAFFDFVAKGTTQMYVQRLTENHLKGFYFLQLEKEQMKDKQLDIESFYENESCEVYNSYYILETLLTAPHPSVQDFDDGGAPVYSVETRAEKDILCFGLVQEGIVDYFKTYIGLCPETERGVNKKLDEVFLRLIHKVKIQDEIFRGLVVEDPFFNRMTKISDLI